MALIYGQVFEEKVVGKKMPLGNVHVEIEGAHIVTITNSSGEFLLCVPTGIYNVLIFKDGYETLRLKDYKSDQDQISNAAILLGHGTDEDDEELPKWKR